MDFETRSLIDLIERGLDNYRRDVEALMLGWAIDKGPVNLWQPRLGPMPEELTDALHNQDNLLIAFNAPFERNIFQYSKNIPNTFFPYHRWRDVMILGHSWSLQSSLAKVGVGLKLPVQFQKDATGEKLIDLFCLPLKKDNKKTGKKKGEFNDWNSHPTEWELFCGYCIQDVASEREIWYRLMRSPLPENEWRGWFLDQKMNERGMLANRQMATNALELGSQSKTAFREEMIRITGLENPNSTMQLMQWVVDRGYDWGSLRKEFVTAELKNPDSKITKECREVLKLRQAASSNAHKKFERMLDIMGPDDRTRFQFRFGAASRTMRWAGSDVQTQNMLRPIKAVSSNFQKAIDLIMAKDYETIKKEYPSVIGMVASSQRMAFKAPAGKKLVVCDLNAIENRGLGFLARENAILDVFAKGRDPYLAFGVYLYNKTYEELEALYKAGNKDIRQNAKAPVLGGGYALGGGDLYVDEFGNEVRGGLWGYALNVCGVDMPRELAHKAVKILRAAWPAVPQYWRDLEQGFKDVLRTGTPINIGERTYAKGFREEDGTYVKPAWEPVSNIVDGTIIRIDRIQMPDGGYTIRLKLPSNRFLHYLNATVESETIKYEGKPWTRQVIYYDGIEHSATQSEGQRARKSSAWGRVKTYGGKLTENVVQAFSRDLLLNSMMLMDEMGFEIVGCFHDEVMAEAEDTPEGLTIQDMRNCMIAAPVWAPSCPLGAEGYESQFYKKE